MSVGGPRFIASTLTRHGRNPSAGPGPRRFFLYLPCLLSFLSLLSLLYMSTSFVSGPDNAPASNSTPPSVKITISVYAYGTPTPFSPSM